MANLSISEATARSTTASMYCYASQHCASRQQVTGNSQLRLRSGWPSGHNLFTPDSFKDALRARQCSHRCASTTSCAGAATSRQRLKVQGALFEPPKFSPEKLTLRFLPGTPPVEADPLCPRRYTLTHNDLTGQLQLSVGRDYNKDQLSGWYTRLVRDEVLGEWLLPAASNGNGNGSLARGPLPELHVHCHVSGQARWLASPALRSFIFRREMELVLDTFNYGDRALLRERPELADAPVLVHLSSHVEALHQTVAWGLFGRRATWAAPPSPLLEGLWDRLLQPWRDSDVLEMAGLRLGGLPEADGTPAASSSAVPMPIPVAVAAARMAGPLAAAAASEGLRTSVAASLNGSGMHEDAASDVGTAAAHDRHPRPGNPALVDSSKPQAASAELQRGAGTDVLGLPGGSSRVRFLNNALDVSELECGITFVPQPQRLKAVR